MKLFALAVVSSTTLLLGSTGTAFSAGASSDSNSVKEASPSAQLILAKQGRGGHDDPPGDDHTGLVLAKQGRGGHDDPPGDDHTGLVLAKQGRGGHDDPPGDDHTGLVLAKQGRGGHDDPPGDDHGVVLG
ncbi:MAG: hypothetical protein KF793_16175 [Nitrospira sp.]|nr:hypothetical protein [Nitrospira sp.]